MNIETANRLYQFRKQHHLSQEELAEKIGVSRQAISKWERAEASPDTDNLILLAQVYGVTLDELLMGRSPSGDGKEEMDSQNPGEDAETEDAESEKEDRIFFQNGIHVEGKNGDRVHVGWDGIYVHDEKKDTHVTIDKNGIIIDENGKESTDLKEKMKEWGEEHEERKQRRKAHAFWYHFPYPVLALIGFFVWGFLGGWYISWLLFLTIPLYYTLVEAVIVRKPNRFAYPVLATVIFLGVGLACSVWHPTWIVFLTIPLYYYICEWIEKGWTK